MTIETKTTLQLSDIITVEFECAQCHAVTSWPLLVARNPPTRCRCTEQDWMGKGSDMYSNISDLITLLQQFSKAKNGPFIMRFGINYDASLARASGSKV